MMTRSPFVCLCSTPGVGRTPGMFSIEGNIIGTVGAIMSTAEGLQYTGGYQEYTKGMS